MAKFVSGPKLPINCIFGSMITSPDGNGVILLGCSASRDTIYELKNVNGGFEWIEKFQKLKYPREHTVPMLIPDYLTNCH